MMSRAHGRHLPLRRAPGSLALGFFGAPFCLLLGCRVDGLPQIMIQTTEPKLMSRALLQNDRLICELGGTSREASTGQGKSQEIAESADAPTVLVKDTLMLVPCSQGQLDMLNRSSGTTAENPEVEAVYLVRCPAPPALNFCEPLRVRQGEKPLWQCSNRSDYKKVENLPKCGQTLASDGKEEQTP